MSVSVRFPPSQYKAAGRGRRGSFLLWPMKSSSRMWKSFFQVGHHLDEASYVPQQAVVNPAARKVVIGVVLDTLHVLVLLQVVVHHIYHEKRQGLKAKQARREERWTLREERGGFNLPIYHKRQQGLPIFYLAKLVLVLFVHLDDGASVWKGRSVFCDDAVNLGHHLLKSGARCCLVLEDLW